MSRYLGIEFGSVSPRFMTCYAGVLVITDPVTQKKMVLAIRRRSNEVMVETYNGRAAHIVGADNAANLDYEWCYSDGRINPTTLAQSIRADFDEKGITLRMDDIVRKDGKHVNLENVEYYIYAMRNVKDNSIYVDYDFADKRLRNPMIPKASTFNSHVANGVQGSNNRTMHQYVTDNYPIHPGEWNYNKVGPLVKGRSKAIKLVGELSAELIRSGVCVLNALFSMDAHQYYNTRIDAPRISMKQYLNRHLNPSTLKKILEIVP